MEERIARLEEVEHIQSDVTEIKGRLQRLEDKIDGIKDGFGKLREEMRVGYTGAILGVMARGFKWI